MPEKNIVWEGVKSSAMAGWENKIILKRCEGGAFLRKTQMCLSPIEAARAENLALAALIGVNIRAFL